MRSRGTKTRTKAWTPDSMQDAVIRVASSPKSLSCRRVLRSFVCWLSEERGLMWTSIRRRIGPTKAFLETVTGGEKSCVRRLRRLTFDDVEIFFVEYCSDRSDRSYAVRRQMQAAMRCFLAFSVVRGWVAPELAGAVPRLSSYRLSGLPRGIREEDLALLLQSFSDCGSSRDIAIVLLLACYGVRRKQVADLRLSDIAWRNREIIFQAMKGGKPVRHELLPAVAEALGSYLHSERPEGDVEYVFLRSVRPHIRLSPEAVSNAVASGLRRAGVESLPRGPHALRHAFAQRLLHAGQPLKVVADLLGHRTLSATSIYAKVDHPRRLEVALEWPEALS